MSGAHIVIVGGGGREHALLWKLRQSPQVSRISMTSRNHAAAKLATPAPADFAELAAFCLAEKVSLVVVGPEVPLAAGIADALRAEDISVLGPTQNAARIESSKIYAKQLMQRCGIRTADFALCDTAADVAAWTKQQSPPYVLKADGLAAGKGVLICQTADEAQQGAKEMLGGKFGDASKRLLAEAHVSGREMSFMVLTDGARALPMATARDYKRLQDGDAGPNTGGMGVLSPAEDAGLSSLIMDEVIMPALAGLAEDGAPFCGFLYAGLMVADDGAISVLEFNCRLGDPETQVLLPRLQSDLYPSLLAAAEGDLFGHELQWSEQAAVGVVLAAAGYPDKPRAGDVISLPPENDNALVFHAGTTTDDAGRPQTSGGRVLTVVGLATSIEQARHNAYKTAAQINFDGAQFRQDIARG